MKARTLCLALGAAQLALCGPIPTPQTEHHNQPAMNHDRSVASRQIRVSQSPNQPESSLFKVSANPPRSADEEEQATHKLWRHRIDSIPIQHHKDLVPGLQQPANGGSDITESLNEKMGVPCHGYGVSSSGLAAAERNDTLILMLALVFLVAVVVFETWESFCKSPAAPVNVDDGGRRTRSRSPGRRTYADDDDDRSYPRAPPNVVDAVPYPTSSYQDPASSAYQYERLAAWPTASDGQPDYYRDPVYSHSRHESESRRDRDSRRRDRDSDSDRDKSRPELYLPSKYAANIKTVEPPSPRQSRDSIADSGRDRESDKERERRRKKEKLENDLAYGKLPGPSKYESPPSPIAAPASAPSPYTYASAPPPPITTAVPPSSYTYASPPTWEYAKPEEQQPRYSSTHLEVGPRPGRASSPGPPSPTLKSALKRDKSPQPPTQRMSMLTVQTPHHSASLSVSSAAPSPLLEAYKGTWQSISPMPSPMLPPGSPSINTPQILEGLSPIDYPSDDDGRRRRGRRARFNDPADNAARLAEALRGEKRRPDTEPLIEILPGLTHEQVMELRVEYKKIVKTGSERKGVNIAKHIRARLKDEDPTLMKACYATALGRWESEAYWANFWYHGDKTRRELLIEALMGRTNEEIRAIKDGFSDKKYGNSLSKCMRTELKEDKFKKAVLMVLEEGRMEEADGYGRPLRIDYDLVDDDVRQLHRAVTSEKGGESLMMSIVILRSDAHLREVLREYKNRYKGANFAKDALKKSGNLVGEVLAHILNGIINKPMRDAMLLHHALTASRSDELRRELLISRLVRVHWDARHMALVKRAFREQYGRELQDAVREATRGDWGEFCVALCIERVPDAVKRVERVDIHR
ncbi:hypothetical protein VTJ49DRAFT_1668 [Mycothermus thermophilus]|uniref:Annexin ANXC4 n=1 Tax=Humicola insolens TaxID=85995 RepID=A0ABR3VCE9_HUMIN